MISTALTPMQASCSYHVQISSISALVRDITTGIVLRLSDVILFTPLFAEPFIFLLLPQSMYALNAFVS
jgi:hypothetical protein